MAEYSTLTPQATPVTRYLTSDHLGSPRIITGSNGAVLSRRDFMPYGEEAFIGVGNRAVGHGYTYGDSTREKFTGYERDEESNLDFAQARMHNYNHGRFRSPDPLMASAKLLIPQSFNRFAYVTNNPINLVDPFGLIWLSKGDNIYWLDDDDYPKNPNAYKDYTIVLNGSIYFGTQNGRNDAHHYVLNADGSITETADPALVVQTENDFEGESKKLSFGLAWTGRLDYFTSGEGFEMHVVDPSGKERGIVSGRNGWIAKHGYTASPPKNIPRAVLDKINGANVSELRRRGAIPQKGTAEATNVRGGGYLRAGARVFTVFNFVHGLITDAATLKQARENNLTMQQQSIINNQNTEYISTPFGVFPTELLIRPEDKIYE